MARACIILAILAATTTLVAAQDGMACKLNLSESYPGWAGCFGNPAFLEATYYIVICPES